MSGFLGDLGLGDVSIDNTIPDGTYPGFVTKSEIITKKDGSQAWKLTYRVVDEFPTASGFEQEEWWNNLGNMTDKAKGFLKRRVLMLGIPESEINTLQPQRVIGTPVWFKVYTNKNGYKAMGDIKLRRPENIKPEDYIKDPEFNEVIGGYPSNPVAGGSPTSSIGSPVVGGTQVGAGGIPAGL